jgi:hypothetical protein
VFANTPLRLVSHQPGEKFYLPRPGLEALTLFDLLIEARERGIRQLIGVDELALNKFFPRWNSDVFFFI